MWGLTQKEKNENLRLAFRREKWNEVKKELARGADPNATVTYHGSPLFDALYMYDDTRSLDIVSALLAARADVNKKDNGGRTPLHYLLLNRADHLQVLRKLLASGADVSQPYNNSTPLGLALNRQAWDAAGIILDHKPEQERPAAAGGETPLTVAGGETLLTVAVARNAPLELIRRLMKRPLDVNERPAGGGPALQLAARASRQDLVEYLLGCPGIDVNAGDGQQNTALLAAADQGRPALAASLLKAGADPNRANSDGRTPLLAADGAELVSLLLAHGALPDQSDRARTTPLLAAARRKNAGVARALLEGGAAPDLADADGKTPLLTAVIDRNRDVVRALLAGGAAPGLADAAGRTPLLAAVTLNDAELVSTLLEAGARPEQPGAGGLEPLLAATQQGSVALVAALLAAASASGAKLALGPALLAATEKGNVDLMEALLAAGADANTADAEGRTPLMKAALTDRIEVMSILVKAGAKTDAEDARGMQAFDHAVSAKKNQSKDYLARFRADGARGGFVMGAGDAENRYTLLNRTTLEVREAENLSVIFNFWMQQVIFRDTSRDAPLTVQNFVEVQRQESIREAWEKLKELGGDAPEPVSPSLQKKAPGLARG